MRERSPRRPWLAAWLTAATTVCLAGPGIEQARAEPAQAEDASLGPAPVQRVPRLQWRPAWGERLWPELAVGSVTFTAALVGRVGIEGTHYPRWTRAGRFDRRVFEAFGNDKRSIAVRRAATATWYISEFWAPAVDAVLVAWAGDRNTRVALHLLAMDLQSLSLSGLTSVYSQLIFARERPGRDCDARQEGCKHTGSAQSFISGHTAMAFTGASLICLQHRHLPLYGHRIADALACGVALASATTTGALRLALHAHWASDVIAGAATGFLFGWLVPWAQHFRRASNGGTRGWAWLAAPWADGHGAGMALWLRH